MFLCLNKTSCVQFVPDVSCPGTVHHWKDYGSLHPYAPFRDLYILLSSPRASSSPVWIVPAFSTFSHLRDAQEMSSPFIIFVTLCDIFLTQDSLKYVHVSLVLESPEMDIVLHVWPHQCWAEWKDHLPWPPAMLCLIQNFLLQRNKPIIEELHY